MVHADTTLKHPWSKLFVPTWDFWFHKTRLRSAFSRMSRSFSPCSGVLVPAEMKCQEKCCNDLAVTWLGLVLSLPSHCRYASFRHTFIAHINLNLFIENCMNQKEKNVSVCRGTCKFSKSRTPAGAYMIPIDTNMGYITGDFVGTLAHGSWAKLQHRACQCGHWRSDQAEAEIMEQQSSQDIFRISEAKNLKPLKNTLSKCSWTKMSEWIEWNVDVWKCLVFLASLAKYLGPRMMPKTSRISCEDFKTVATLCWTNFFGPLRNHLYKRPRSVCSSVSYRIFTEVYQLSMLRVLL